MKLAIARLLCGTGRNGTLRTENGSLWFIVQASENHSSVEILHTVYTGASFCHVKGKLSLRKQQILPHLVKNMQDVAGYCCGPQLGREF